MLAMGATFTLIALLFVALAIMWPNLGVGRGSQYRREYTFIAKQHLMNGEVFESAKWIYRAGKWGIQSEIKWIQLQDDIESFQSLIDSKNYIEADSVCLEVRSIFEHGPGPAIWENFNEDCWNASDIAFNEKIQFCRDSGFESPQNPEAMVLQSYFSSCEELWKLANQ